MEPTLPPLPPFQPSLLQELRTGDAGGMTDPLTQPAHLTDALVQLLAQLGHPIIDSSNSTPFNPFFLLDPLSVRVRYLAPGNPAAGVPLLLDLLSDAQMIHRAGRHPPHWKGFAELRRGWLEGCGWPTMTVDPTRWHDLMRLEPKEQLATLEQWVQQAVKEWEERMAQRWKPKTPVQPGKPSSRC